MLSTRWRSNRQTWLWAITGIVLCSIVLYSTVLASPVNGEPLFLTTKTPESVLLFEDNFATYSGRWNVTESPKATVTLADQRLQFMINAPGVSTWSVPDFSTPLHNYQVEVSAYLVDGEANAQYGIVLDYEDDETFYAMLVTLAGEWRLVQHRAGKWDDLTPREPAAIDWPKHEPGEPIRLAVAVTGNTVTLAVNEQGLDPITVAEALTGSVFGLIARAEQGHITVAFDDLAVTAQTGANHR